MAAKASILIVDDNISLCRTMSFVLEHKGYAVTSAKDGPEAFLNGTNGAMAKPPMKSRTRSRR